MNLTSTQATLLRQLLSAGTREELRRVSDQLDAAGYTDYELYGNGAVRLPEEVMALLGQPAAEPEPPATRPMPVNRRAFMG